MSKLIIKKYENTDLINWDKFIQESINGGIFHEQKFISYHQNKFNDSSFLFFKNDELIALFPAAIITKNDKLVLKSHPGTSYGGFVLNKELPLKLIFSLIKLIEEYCLKNSISTIEFRHSPNIFRKESLDQLDFALSYNNYQRIDEELSTCFSLSKYKDLSINEMIQLFDNSSRSKAKKNINKAIKLGLSFRKLNKNEISLFYEILETNLVKHNAKPVHSLKEIESLVDLYPDRVSLFGVFLDEKLIAGYLIFNVNQIGNHIFYGSLDYNYQDYRSTSYGLFMLMHTFAQEGHKYLNMGISTEDGGKIINWQLYDFKESFNGTGTIRYYWQKHLL
ncbi:hypothetical protein OAQ99_01595 [Candidatus Kapabacteria bacterium]|nr:hypothetical protein [Candidatus Kapabacteria bacterium]